MLTAWCDERGARVLIPTDRVLGITNSDAGVRVVYRCWCDEVCVWQADRPTASFSTQ